MEPLLTEKQLAVLLQISILTIRRNRCTAPHRLPPHLKFGSSVRYRVTTVLKWLEEHEVGKERPEQREYCNEGKSPKEKRPGPGRPTKAETVRKTKNANR